MPYLLLYLIPPQIRLIQTVLLVSLSLSNVDVDVAEKKRKKKGSGRLSFDESPLRCKKSYSRSIMCAGKAVNASITSYWP